MNPDRRFRRLSALASIRTFCHSVHTDVFFDRWSLVGKSRKPIPCPGDDVRKRSPLEQAIAEKKDRRARYEAKLRRNGLKTSTLATREEYWPVIRAFAADLNEGDKEAAIRNLQRRLGSL